jgi:hypothetical protein
VKLAAKVDKGRVVWADPASLAITMRHFEGQPVQIEITKQTQTRSDQSNRRYFGVLLPMVRAFIDEDRKENGLPPLDWGAGDEWKDRLHASLVARHAGVDETPIGPVRKSTRVMTKEQFFAYTESVTRWLAEHGWYVPEQGEAVGA